MIYARKDRQYTFVRIALFVVLVLTLFSAAGCSPLEQQAYRLVVSSHAFLKQMANQHPECATPTATPSALCKNLAFATYSKDLLIDATEVYCAGPDFNGGGKCNPPAKGTPAYVQATAKLQAAMSLYAQAEKDLKGAVGK